MILMKFKIKHLGNLLIRFFTKDKCYVCEECKRIHKRDGKEIRLDAECDRSILLSHPLWYGSVHRDCFDKQQAEVRKMLREAILGK